MAGFNKKVSYLFISELKVFLEIDQTGQRIEESKKERTMLKYESGNNCQWLNHNVYVYDVPSYSFSFEQFICKCDRKM